MISSDWLFKWKCFVTNKISKAVNQNILQEINQSSNNRIGILPPGAITNFKLFEQDGVTLDQTIYGGVNTSKSKSQTTPEIREQLIVELDYKTVKKEVWSKFVKIYSGGPAIVREKPHIYSAVVEDTTSQSSNSSPSKPVQPNSMNQHPKKRVGSRNPGGADNKKADGSNQHQQQLGGNNSRKH